VTEDVDLAALAAVGRAFCSACESINDDQWALPSNLLDWMVQDLVDHVVGGNWYSVAVLGGASSDEAIRHAMNSFNGPTGLTVVLRSTHELLAAFESPGVLDQHHDHVLGQIGGRTMLKIRVHEMAVHAWDVATSIGVDSGMPTDVIEWIVAELASPDSTSLASFDIEHVEVLDQAGYLRVFGRI